MPQKASLDRCPIMSRKRDASPRMSRSMEPRTLYKQAPRKPLLNKKMMAAAIKKWNHPVRVMQRMKENIRKIKLCCELHRAFSLI